MLSKIIELAKYSSCIVPITHDDYLGDGSKILQDKHGNTLFDSKGQALTDKGLVYCGNCNTRKQTRMYSAALGRILEPFCLCSCLMDNERKIENEFRKRQKQIEIEHNLRKADRLMLQSTFAKDKCSNSDISRFCKDYCRCWIKSNKPKNIGLYIYGDVGTGKSFYASCIANEIAKVFGDSIKAISAKRVVDDLFNVNDKSGYIDDLVQADLFILDDLGAERKTEFAAEQIFAVIDERYKIQKPIIITSNLDYDKICSVENLNYKRIYDRVIDMCLPVHCGGKSKRGLVR